MTDETSDSDLPSEASAPVPSEPEATAPVAVATAPVALVPFWHRPNVDRFLVPLITPIIVVLGLVVYVLNLSRIFLSAHGHTSVVVGSTLTVVILVGATVLANSARLRTQTMTLMTVGFLFVVFGSGWLVLGHSQEKNLNQAVLTKDGSYSDTMNITAGAGGQLAFAPSSLSAKTGIYLVTLTDGANTQHTLNFDQTSTLWAGLVVNTQGEKLQSRIFFPAPGTYTYYCAVTGHRAAGMQGTITVTGPPLTLAQAEAAGKQTSGGSGATAAK